MTPEQQEERSQLSDELYNYVTKLRKAIFQPCLRFPGWDKEDASPREVHARNRIFVVAEAIIAENLSYDENTPISFEDVAFLLEYIASMLES